MLLGLASVLVLAASCEKHSYDFSNSPSSPKAGETVKFTNLSDAGENWVWRFGDGKQSTLKNPSHIYTAAGTYTVELMVDSNRNRRVTHVLEVLDSIPRITLSSDTVPQYKPITLRAALYNPNKSTVSYQWAVDDNLFVITHGSLTTDSVTGYFTDYGINTEVGLTITVGSKTTTDSRTLRLVDNVSASLIMQSANGVLWRQRIYDGLYESAKAYPGDEAIMDQANDSVATLNGVTYDIHNMPILPDRLVSALQVDPVNRKIYLVLEDGVYVANANGDALTCIAQTDAGTLLIDSKRNSIYWSDGEGVWVMPLVTNPQNTIGEQLRSKIRQVNGVDDLWRMILIEN